MAKKIEGHIGSYGMDQSDFPVRPEDVRVPHKYTCYSDLYGDKGVGEAAARLITHCQSVGQWCGVSIVSLLERLRIDAASDETIESVCLERGTQSLFVAFHALVGLGMITDLEEDGTIVLYPNPTLLDPIADYWKDGD